MTDHSLAYSVLVALVESGYARLHVHPAGLNLPEPLTAQSSVCLVLGPANPFANFAADVHGWRADIPFQGVTRTVAVPWGATQAVLNADSKGLLQSPRGWLMHTGALPAAEGSLEGAIAALLTPEARRKGFRVVQGGMSKAAAKTPRKPPPEEWGDDDGQPVPEGA